MNKKIIKIGGYIFLAIIVLLIFINLYLEYTWQKKSETFYEDQERVLNDALEKGNVEACKNYPSPLTCVFLASKKKNDPDLCNRAYLQYPEIIGCKAILLGNQTYCEKNIDNEKEVEKCKRTFHLLTLYNNE